MKLQNGTIIIDLNRSEEELWNTVQKDNRWSVNKARRENIVVKEGGDKDRCYELYTTMCTINKLIPLKKEALFDLGKVFTAWKDDVIVSFAIIKEDETPILRINASDYEYRNTQANSLLYWEFIKYYKNKGHNKINLGGVDLHSQMNKGIDVFKQRWGGVLSENEHDVSFLNYIWWKYLRHNALVRNIKYKMQTKLKR